MIEIIALGLLVALVAFWRAGNSLRSLLIAWLVAVTPSTLGLIHYSYQYTGSNRYAAYIAASIISFMIGYFGYYQVAGYKLAQKADLKPQSFDYFDTFRQPIIFVGITAFLAITFMLLDVVTSGIDVADLTSIRAEVVSRDSSSVLARLASITTWACFVCLAFAVYYRERLSRPVILLLLLLGAGTVLSSLFSAGRQALLQTILLLIFVEGYRRKTTTVARGKGVLGRALVITAVIAVFLYVSLTRSRSDYGLARVDVLLRLFGADLPPGFEDFLSYFPTDISDFLVEVVLYLSHSVPLFSIFADIEFPERYWGQNSFPFLFRQIEPITGWSVQSALLTKIEYLNASGVLGVGWNTALSQTSMDFGLFGTTVLYGIFGWLSRFWEVRAKYQPGFIPSTMSSLLMISAIYTPFVLLFSDTSMLFLFLFMTIMSGMSSTLSRRVASSQGVMRNANDQGVAA